MDKNEVAQRVRSVIIETLELDKPLENDDVKLVDDLQADSVDQISIIMAIEDEFEGDINDEVVQSIVTIGDVIEITWSELQKKSVLDNDL